MTRSMASAACVAGAVGLWLGIRAVAAPAAEQAASPGQGIAGKVVKLAGNFMPGPGAPGGRTAPLSVPVHIFKGKVIPFQKPDPAHPALVKIVQSGKDGTFRCELPPGEYTVVAAIDGKLYLNLYMSGPDGARWGTVQVEAGKWTAVTIEDTTGAAF